MLINIIYSYLIHQFMYLILILYHQIIIKYITIFTTINLLIIHILLFVIIIVIIIHIIMLDNIYHFNLLYLCSLNLYSILVFSLHKHIMIQ